MLPAPQANPPSKMSTADCLAGGGELGARMREIDWSQTVLGPVEQWPQSLKTCVRIILTSRQPMFVWWGEHLINLYNDAYKAIVGGKHPEALGQPASVVWREIWDQVGPRAETAILKNEGTYDEALLLIMERYGYPEETYYTFSYSPVPNDHGGTGGIICANTDDTQRIIGERRLALLRDLAACTTDRRSVEEVCAQSIRCLSANLRDLPFAMIYRANSDRKRLMLAGASGFAESGGVVPQEIAPESEVGQLCAQVLETHKLQIISDLSGWLGHVPRGAWPQPPQQAAVLHIATDEQGGQGTVLVVGLNPFRLWDAEHQGFVELVAGQIASSLSNANAYEAERRRAEMLAELDRAKTAFFSNVSHEFRTPLTLLLGPVEEILSKPSGQVFPDNRGLLTLVHRNALRLQKLVNTLLDFSRIEAGRTQAVYEAVDLAVFTADLASVFRSATERAGLQLIVDCPPLEEPAYVDREMWEKVVLNLLSNAFKFTLEGEIAVALRFDGDAFCLRVRDTGVGIPPQELPRVFERFHRVEGQRGRTHEGTGIGLALVQELVRLHGGTVHVESTVENPNTEDHGTTFWVRIPKGHAHLPSERIGGERTLTRTSLGADHYLKEAERWLPGDNKEGLLPASVGTDARGEEPSSSLLFGQTATQAGSARVKPRILLADDNADMREYVHRLLAAFYDVEAAADGEIALAAAERQLPDLVLTDVMMPRLDGFGLLQRLRADEQKRVIPVIMLSARAGEEARLEGLAAGADDYLTKPFTARELLARVESQLKLARLRCEGEERLRGVIESITDGFQVVDASGRYTYCNEAGRRMLAAVGADASDLIGKHVFDEAFPETRDDAFGHAFQRVKTERVPVETENYYSPWNTWFRIRLYPSMDGGVLIFFQNITERKKSEKTELKQAERTELLSRILENLLAAQDPGSMVRELCPKVAAHVGADVFFNFMLDDEGDRLRLYTHAGISEEDAKELQYLELGEAVCGLVAQTCQEAILTNIQDSVDARHAIIRNQGIQTYVCNPLISHDRILGTLSFGSRTRTSFEEDELVFLRTISYHVALAVDRLQTGRDLKDREQRMAEQARLLNLSNDAIIVCDWEDRIVYWNRGAEELYGWNSKEAIGRKKYELLCTKFPGPREQVTSELLSRNRWQGELIQTCRNGVRLVVNSRWALDRDTRGRPIAILKSDNDISARKQAEEALRRSEEQLAHAARVAGFGVFDHDHVNQTLYWSPTLRKMHEMDADEPARLEAVFAQVHPEDRDEHFTAVRAAHDPRNDGLFSLDYRIVLSNGGIRWISARAQTFFEGAGANRRAMRTIGVELDITERKQAEDALRRSEERLRLITDNVPALVSYIDRHLVYRFVNAAYFDWFGLEPKQIIGRNIRDVLGEEVYQHRTTHVAAVLRGETVLFEGPTRRGSLGLRHSEIVYIPEKSGTGVVQGFYVFVHDIHDRKVAEETLREREQQLRDAIAATKLGLWSFDPRSGTAQFSSSSRTLAGFPSEAPTLAEGWERVLHPDDREHAMAVFARSLDPIIRGDCFLQYRVVRPDDTVRWLEAVWQVEFSGEGPECRCMRATGTLLDITERKEAQQALEEQAAALREADRRKDEFLAMLAHELRNPLASVSNAVTLLKAADDEESREWAVEVVHRQTGQLARLIDDLLDVSRITSGKIRLRKTRMDVTPVLRSAVETAQPLIAERSHHIHVELPVRSGELSLEGDPTRLEQIVSNLLTNAAKYTERGGTIWLSAARESNADEGDEIVIRVRDTGIGIPPEKIPEMFDLFTQGERSIARSEGGLGIGLTIVRQLVEMHGGDVVAFSEGIGKGSEFVVSLPAADSSAETTSRVTLTEKTTQGNGKGPGARILVVDDNADTARGLARLLKLHGNTVEIAYDGSSALEMACMLMPQFVLLDIGLPGMDGYEVCRRLRQRFVETNPVVIAVSGYGQEEDRRRSREAGFDHHLVKPVDLSELRALLEDSRKPQEGASHAS